MCCFPIHKAIHVALDLYLSALTTTLIKDYVNTSDNRTKLTAEKLMHDNPESATTENNSIEKEMPDHHDKP